MEYRDKNYQIITVGAEVDVPVIEDNVNFEFRGHVDSLTDDGYVVVKDMEDNAFCVEPELLELVTRSYRVVWEIDVNASTPEQAAWLAREIQRDRDSEALAFDVKELATGEESFLELLSKEDPRISAIKRIIEKHGTFSTYDVEADSSPYVAGAGFVISLAETFNHDSVKVVNYNGGREESEYDTTYDQLPDETINQIFELAQQWAEVSEEE